MTQFLSIRIINRTVITLIIFLYCQFGFSQPNMPQRKLNIPPYSGTAKELIEQIGKSEELVFAYSSEVNLSFEVKFQKSQVTLNEFLDALLRGKPIAYKINGNKIMLFPRKDSPAQSLKLSQTVRGTIIDIDSKQPLIGVTITIAGSDPFVGTVTNAEGSFKLQNVPLGRIDLQISCIGYNALTIPNIEVNSGKEVVLELNMKEATTNINEVVVKAFKNKGDARNEMSIISARSISVEETKRYAAGYDDPSHILTNFAGVSYTPSGNNDIIVRGNAPKYVQWRLEGVEITAPNHQADQNSTVGGFSALNNTLLAASDFYSGAFSPEFGDVLAGVYDIKLRQGNNEKFEATAGVGIMGTNFTVEGPLKKGYNGSYLVNYRFSNLGLVQALKIADIPGISTTFQDANFKLVLPTKKLGSLSIFGLLGADNLKVEKVAPNVWQTPGTNQMMPDILQGFEQNNYLINFGITHTLSINSNSFIKTTLSYSSTGIEENVLERLVTKTPDANGVIVSDTSNRILNYKSTVKPVVSRGTVQYSNRLDARNKLVVGIEYAIYNYKTNQSQLDRNTNARFTLIDFDGRLSTLKNFVSWKHQFNSNISMVAGIHNMNSFFNHQSTLEPRIALSWQLNNSSSFHAGYGKHSNMERMHNYFTRIQQPDGTITEPNKNLGFLKADHYVLGFDKRFTENLMAKVEVYYQRLYDLPVENNDSSYYCTINEGSDYKYVPLVNKGTGKNYGIELTLERFFSNHFYFLMNASVFDSKYKAIDGIERNTRFNSNFIVNILGGKEFENLGKKKNKTLAINAKFFMNGGQRYIPLLRDANGNLAVDPANNRFWDYSKAYTNKLDYLYHFDISLSYKINKAKSTHEIFLDLPNLTNHQGKMTEYYDASQPNKIGYITQMVFLPNIMYRVYF